jgi:flagellar biogenesis protein FliO
MLPQSLAVFLVLALLLGALWLLRRQGLAGYGLAAGLNGTSRRTTGRRLRVVERLALTQQHSLHLVSIGDQLVVFATSPAGCQRMEPPLAINPLNQEAASTLQTGASC